MPRDNRKSSVRRRRPAPLLAVELSIHRADGGVMDKKHVVLVGNRQKIRARAMPGAPGLLDLETAARQIGRGIRPEGLAGLLAALAHPHRVQILLKLLGGEATHRSLSKATGLKAGPLYHHLRELRMAGLIGPKVRDLYVLTRKGGRAILVALAMERLCG
jgi:DNA-binding transcriptional ArsR family regulator